MRRWLAPGAGFVVVLAGAELLGAPRAELPADEQVRALMAQRLDQAGGSGAVVVALLDHGVTRYLSVGGSGNPARPQADEHTLFQIGSVTKTFTAFLLAEAVKRGEARLDDRLDRTLRDRTGTREDGAGSATLEELATHTSGLPRLPLEPTLLLRLLQSPRDPYRDYTEADLDRFLAKYRRGPERAFDYSNLGYALLAKALERAAGKPYAALVRERITEPLGLGETFVGVPASARDRAAVGHDRAGDPTPAWSPGAFAGAGAIWSTAADLSRYLDALRDPRAGAQPAVLAVHATREPERSVGLGWMLDAAHDDDIAWHNGGTGGFRSFAGFSRRSGLGVVVLGSTEQDVTDLGLHLLNGGYKVRRPRSHLVLKAFAAAVIAVTGLRLALQARPPSSRLARLLVGKGPAGRAEAAARVLHGISLLVVTWHVAPWDMVGGRGVRLGVAVAAGLGALVTLARARGLPWLAAAGWGRAKLGVSAAISAAILAVAVRW